jgi:hypothetical protein
MSEKYVTNDAIIFMQFCLWTLDKPKISLIPKLYQFLHPFYISSDGSELNAVISQFLTEGSCFRQRIRPLDGQDAVVPIVCVGAEAATLVLNEGILQRQLTSFSHGARLLSPR